MWVRSELFQLDPDSFTVLAQLTVCKEMNQGINPSSKMTAAILVNTIVFR